MRHRLAGAMQGARREGRNGPGGEAKGEGSGGRTYSANEHAANGQWPFVGHALSQVLGIQGTHPREGLWSQAAWGLAPSGFPQMPNISKCLFHHL